MKKYLPKPILAVLVLFLIVLGISWLESQKAGPSGSFSDETSIDVVVVAGENSEKTKSALQTNPKTCEQPAQKIVNSSGYVNTGGEPITIKEFIGKEVILVDFMTYSCINCQRTFPYVTAWWEKYKDEGLQVIGIHTPEFDFEKKKTNVVRAMEKFGIEYPVVLDNAYGTWRSYENHYWPHKFLIDIHGCIVYDHIGEGAYRQTEQVIQRLLEERARVLGSENSVPGGFVSP